MSKVTERMLQAAAGLTILYYGYNLIAGSVVQMVNLSLANRELRQEVAACNKGGTSPIPHGPSAQ